MIRDESPVVSFPRLVYDHAIARFGESAMTLSRRQFAAAGLLAVPAITYRNALMAAQPPSERVRVGMIGVGNQGGPKNNMKYFGKNIVAICDVDTNYLAEAGAFQEKNGQPKPAAYGDFRKLLDAKDIDAVVVTVPDQWHCLMTVMACEAGKHVYCEKPLTLVVSEGPKMIAAARKHKKIVQTGSMQRSGREFETAVKMVRDGAVGKVHTVNVGLPKPNWSNYQIAKGAAERTPIADAPPPPELDWDLWLGPAPDRKYNKFRVHYLFRFFWDYSGGQMTNFGAHHLDIAQWGLGMDETGPVSIDGKAVYHPKGHYETPDTTDITYTYANGVKLHCLQGGLYPQGTEFIGDKGSLFVGRGVMKSSIPDLLKGIDWKEKAGQSPNTKHVQNFFDCIKSGKLPAADVAIGHRSATVCHLGNIACRVGEKIAWDPAKETIVGNAKAQAMLTKEYRKPWAMA
jgi:predicted dehydrogenase